MKIKFLLTSLCCAFMVWTGGAAERVICVTKQSSLAPKGAQTVSSLQKGIDLAGRYKKQGDDVTLYVAAGTYKLDKTLELTEKELGTDTGSLSIKPLGNGDVILTGGTEVDLKYMEPVPASETRVRPEVREKVYKVDLKKAGVGQIGEIRNSGFSRPAIPAWTEVFINGQAQKLSRWPNDTMALMGQVYDTGSIPRVGDMANKGGSFGYYDDRPSEWQSQPRWIAGYFAHGYADDMVRIASIDTENKKITLDEAVMYGLISGEDFNRWYVVNLLEEVDVPGEYYIDYDKQELWIYPTETVRSISLSMLAEPMLALEGVKNVEVSGIRLECSRGIGIYMERTEDVLIKGCTLRNLGATAIVLGKGIEPFKHYGHSAIGTPASRVVGSLAQHIYEDTAFDREGGFRNQIVDCIIDEVGAGGISLGGGNRKTFIAGKNEVINCRISRYNRVERSYRPAIDLMGVGNHIAHCEIFDAPSSAIMIHGNDHLIEYNEIYDVCKEIDDLGAIYFGRDQSELGIKVMYNYIHHMNDKHRVTAIYHDDGACGMYCYGNIIYKAGLQPVLLGGGSDNYYENNMIIDMPYGLYVDNRVENWGGTQQSIDLYRKRFEAVDYLTGPFATKYPFATQYFEEGIGIPKRNRAVGNLFYDISKMLVVPGERPYERSYMELRNNWWTWSGKGFEDPGFVDAENENWNLKSDAAIFKNIPGFKAIPFDEIGCTLPK